MENDPLVPTTNCEKPQTNTSQSSYVEGGMVTEKQVITNQATDNQVPQVDASAVEHMLNENSTTQVENNISTTVNSGTSTDATIESQTVMPITSVDNTVSLSGDNVAHNTYDGQTSSITDSFAPVQPITEGASYNQYENTVDMPNAVAHHSSGNVIEPVNTYEMATVGTYSSAETVTGAPVTADYTQSQTTTLKPPRRRGRTVLLMVCALIGGAIGGVGGNYLHQKITNGFEQVSFKKVAEPVKPVVNSTRKEPDWAAVAQAVGNSVVAIGVKTTNRAVDGSGVIIDKAGHILTNNHVVADGKDISVTTADGDIYPAKVVGTDPATDLAVIKLTKLPNNLTYATFNVSSDLQVGDPVAAFGNPIGLSHTMTTGIISALERPVITQDKEKLGESPDPVATLAIQVDASINPGNSGGPLFDSQGRVIGINSSIATISEESGSVGLGFAIPADLAQMVSKQIISKGHVNHAFLGVRAESVVAQINEKHMRGARIVQVVDNSTADKAGLREGDIIVSINDHPVVSAIALSAWVRRFLAGETVKLNVLRDGKLLETKAKILQRTDKTF